MHIITIVSGFALIAVFILVGWSIRRRYSQAEDAAQKKCQHSDD